MTSHAAGHRPPSSLRRVVGWCIAREDRDALLAELDGVFARRADTDGLPNARAWYRRQALGFAWRTSVERIAGTVRRLPEATGELALALRRLRRRPAFALAFVLTLGVGTGVIATVASAARWVLLRPVPGVAAAENLVTLRLGSREAPPHVSFEVSQPDLLGMRARLAGIVALAARTSIDADVRTSTGAAERIAAEVVTSNYFAVLGTRIVAGRAFAVDEDSPGAPPVVIVSHSLARRLADDPHALAGTTIHVNGSPVTVAGVTERGFRGADLPGRAELWLPPSALGAVDASAPASALTSPMYGLWRQMVVRVRDGVDAPAIAASANQAMDDIRARERLHSFLATHFQMQAFDGIGLDPGVRASVRRTLSLLGGAAAVLLLLATANLVSLMLTQAPALRATSALRYALGATRRHIARIAVADALVLSAAGTAVAVALSAVWSRWFASAQLSEHGGALGGMRADAVVVALAAGVGLLATALATAVQLHGARVRAVASTLRAGEAGGLVAHRARLALTSLQVALSLILAVGAGLMGRTVANLRAIDLGFDPERLLTFAIDPSSHGLSRTEVADVGLDIERRLRDLPGVTVAGLIAPAPLTSSYLTAALARVDAAPDERPLVGAGFYVTPGMLPALGVRVLAGDEAWRADSGTVVISERALAALYPGMAPRDAIGLTLAAGRARSPARVAAVIADVKLSDIRSDPPPVMFFPLASGLRGIAVNAFVRTSGRPMGVLGAARTAVTSAAPNFSMYAIRTARDGVDMQFAERRVLALVAGTLGTIAVLLAAIGLYGVLASVVAARRRDIGIRSALGAAPLQMAGHVIGLAALPLAAGVAAGLFAVSALERVLEAQLYGIDAFDPATYAGAVAFVLSVLALACALPAFRASRVSPATVLRGE